MIGLSHCWTADRLRQLQPSTAMVVPHGSRNPDQYEAGMIVGSVVALAAALGIDVEWAQLQGAAPRSAVLH
ncbi:hypothetical protein [Methylobacterium longum]|uniref:Uncharacterized protein n=1 Tax=Methylobacterium longum TaxID=767694 RepID=A0ABT8AL48_9HYPH|nr:hypothetical protein [Methylobacterium longum]MDN3570514.1 hypothetical protein [Methylobacterium longum]